jgi:RNA polymerase primary sigma factor
MVETYNKVSKVVSLFVTEFGRSPTHKEIAEKSGLSVEKVNDVINYGAPLASIDDILMEDSDVRFSDILSDNNSPISSFMEDSMNTVVFSSLKELSSREEKILRLRFGIK